MTARKKPNQNQAAAQGKITTLFWSKHLNTELIKMMINMFDMQ